MLLPVTITFDLIVGNRFMQHEINRTIDIDNLEDEVEERLADFQFNWTKHRATIELVKISNNYTVQYEDNGKWVVKTNMVRAS